MIGSDQCMLAYPNPLATPVQFGNTSCTFFLKYKNACFRGRFIASLRKKTKELSVCYEENFTTVAIGKVVVSRV